MLGLNQVNQLCFRKFVSRIDLILVQVAEYYFVRDVGLVGVLKVSNYSTYRSKV